MKIFLSVIAACLILLTAFLAVYGQEQTEEGESLPPVTIDNDYTEWQAVPDIATFTRQFNPYYFSKEEKSEMKALPITDSIFWGYNGTRIKEVKALMAPTSIYFYFKALSPFSKGLIYFMYLHKGREAGTENEYTIEFSINDLAGTNDILLWTFGNEKPEVIGKLNYDTNTLECEIVFARLPEQLGKGLVKFYSFDLTSCFYDGSKGIYEEFFFTTIWFRDIPAEEDL